MSERSPGEKPLSYVLCYEDLATYFAHYPNGVPEEPDDADMDLLWANKEFKTEKQARAFVTKQRKTKAVGYAALYKRENFHDEGFYEPWGWIAMWDYDEEFVTDEF